MMKPLWLIFLALPFLAFVTPSVGQERVPGSEAEITLSFAPIVRASAPSVVNIYARRVVETRVSPFANDPFFSDLFRNFSQTAPRVQNSLGSGVILSADGLVVSNYHVVGGATEIRVVLNDRREFDAKVLLSDEMSDLAVLQLDGAEGLPAMPLKPTGEIGVGDLVLAIGNPFGVGQTVSSGIVSGLARSGGAVGNARAYFIQTDAPINPGNSGGALVDMRGQLVGINTSILTRSGGSNGIGFAIPADLVAAFLEQASAGHTVFERPWAGMASQMVDAAMAEGLNISRPEGTIIVELHPDSPFAAAGLRVGDVITSIAGQQINGPAEMLYHMSVLGVGRNALTEFLRDGRKRSVDIRMIRPPDRPARNAELISGENPLNGLTVSRINPAVIAEIGLQVAATGVVVTRVEGFALRIGFRPGDILREVNGQRIERVRDVTRAARERTRLWDISIERDGQIMSMRFQI